MRRSLALVAVTVLLPFIATSEEKYRDWPALVGSLKGAVPAVVSPSCDGTQIIKVKIQISDEGEVKKGLLSGPKIAGSQPAYAHISNAELARLMTEAKEATGKLEFAAQKRHNQPVEVWTIVPIRCSPPPAPTKQ